MLDNAQKQLIQIVLGAVAFAFWSWLIGSDLRRIMHWLVCNFIVGPC